MGETGVLTIHTDGASRGNPGDAAYAYVIARDDETLIEEAGCLGEMTNNQAEYTALVKALEHALELGPENRVLVHSDSELMVNQMNGVYKVKNPDLRPLYEEARNLVKQFKRPVTIRHVRRGQNTRADELCNEALDGLRLPTPRGKIFLGDSQPAASARPSLRDDAVDCLRRTKISWAGGDSPSPEELWAELTDILRQHGVALPARDGAPIAKGV
jgi:ribonuclease HI